MQIPKMLPTQINELIKKRRAIFPAVYIDQPISKEILQQILENANWAPTHKFTEPWRFKVFRGAALERLGIELGKIYKAKTAPEKFKERKYIKMQKKPMQCGCVMAIVMQRDPNEAIPEWEEIASVAAAVQNMWLTCTAYNIGCYWSSPGIIQHQEMHDFLKLETGEKCLGFLYMGYYDMPEKEGIRQPIDEKIEWIEE